MTINKIKLGSTYYDLQDARVSDISNDTTEYIKGTQTSSTGAFKGVTKDSALYDGKHIIYWLPYAGSGNASLTLTFPNGTNSGAIPIYASDTTRLTTKYGADTAIPMTYISSKSAWYVDADYNTNTDTKVTQTESTAVNPRPIMLGYDSTYTSSNTTNIVYKSANLMATPSTGRVYANGIEVNRVDIGRNRQQGEDYYTLNDDGLCLLDPDTGNYRACVSMGYQTHSDNSVENYISLEAADKVYVEGKLAVGDDTTLNNLAIDGDIVGNVIMTGDLNVKGEACFYDHVELDGSVYMDDSLYVAGDTEFASNVSVNGGHVVTQEWFAINGYNTDYILTSGGAINKLDLRDELSFSDYRPLDILYSDGTVSPKILTTKTPIGICVAPASHFSDGKARFAALSYVNSAGDGQILPTIGTGGQTTTVYPMWQMTDNTKWAEGRMQAYEYIAHVANNGTLSAVEQFSDYSGFAVCEEHNTFNFAFANNYYYEGLDSETSILCPAPFLLDEISKNDVYYATGNNVEQMFTDVDGYINTRKLVLEDDGDIVYPAAYYCDLYNPKSFGLHQWYIPAIGELGYLMYLYPKFEQRLSEIRSAYPLRATQGSIHNLVESENHATSTLIRKVINPGSNQHSSIWATVYLEDGTISYSTGSAYCVVRPFIALEPPFESYRLNTLEYALIQKANISDVYTKSEVYSKSETYNKTEIDNKDAAVLAVVNQNQMAIGAVPSDLTPTENSSNWVTSGGIYEEIQSIKEELSEKINKDGYYDGMGVATATSLLDSNPTSVEFSNRIAGGDADIATGVAVLNTVRGNTLQYFNVLRQKESKQATSDSNYWQYGSSGGGATLTWDYNKRLITYIVGSNTAYNTYFLRAHCKTRTYYAGLTGYSNNGANMPVWFIDFSCKVTPGADTDQTAKRHIAYEFMNQYPERANTKEIEPNKVYHFREVWKQQYPANSSLMYNFQFNLRNGGSGSTVYYNDKWEIWDVNLINITNLYKNPDLSVNAVTADEFYNLFPQIVADTVPFSTWYLNQNLINIKTTGIKTIGFNQYNPNTGTAYLLGGNQYQITGTYTSISKDNEELEVDENGIFTPCYNGTLTVVGGNGVDTCVHLTRNGYRNGEWEEYWEDEKQLDLTTVKDADTNEIIFPNGMNGIINVCDTITSTQAVKRIGIVNISDIQNLICLNPNDSGAGTVWMGDLPSDAKIDGEIWGTSLNYWDETFDLIDEQGNYDGSLRTTNYRNIIALDHKGHFYIFLTYNSTLTSTTYSGLNIYYELANPEVHRVDLGYITYKVDDFGTETILPQAALNEYPTTAPIKMLIKYNIDASKTLNNLPTDYISIHSMYNMLEKIGDELNGAFVVNWNDDDKEYNITFVDNAQNMEDEYETGYISDGELQPTAGYRTSGFIPINVGDVIDFKNGAGQIVPITWWDEEGNFVGNGASQNTRFKANVEVPSGVAYVRLSTYGSNKCFIYSHRQQKNILVYK